MLKDLVKGKNSQNLFKKSYLFLNLVVLTWILKPVTGFNFAAKLISLAPRN